MKLDKTQKILAPVVLILLLIIVAIAHSWTRDSSQSTLETANGNYQLILNPDNTITLRQRTQIINSININSDENWTTVKLSPDQIQELNGENINVSNDLTWKKEVDQSGNTIIYIWCYKLWGQNNMAFLYIPDRDWYVTTNPSGSQPAYHLFPVGSNHPPMDWSAYPSGGTF